MCERVCACVCVREGEIVCGTTAITLNIFPVEPTIGTAVTNRLFAYVYIALYSYKIFRGFL